MLYRLSWVLALNTWLSSCKNQMFDFCKVERQIKRILNPKIPNMKISKTHQEKVLERIEKADKDPGRLLDWVAVQKEYLNQELEEMNAGKAYFLSQEELEERLSHE